SVKPSTKLETPHQDRTQFQTRH
ncbi:hypothetical protein Egran_03049, partial [Elaphomyces granulatus]